MKVNTVEIYPNALDTAQIYARWYEKYKLENFGAFITFTGIVRDESNIEGLSFDIYEPMLNHWFENEQKNAALKNAAIAMAHSQGDVLLHESSFMCVIMSPKRRVALELSDKFVENFKANAPIWKYDLIKGQRVFAKDRSKALNGAGILSQQ
jgi:molybdopterin synthase catalytic subunit